MSPCVALLAGGVGGAKLADGLYRALPHGDLRVIANPGDDFELHGLTICPDHDTLLYTLAGLATVNGGGGSPVRAGTRSTSSARSAHLTGSGSEIATSPSMFTAQRC